MQHELTEGLYPLLTGEQVIELWKSIEGGIGKLTLANAVQNSHFRVREHDIAIIHSIVDSAPASQSSSSQAADYTSMQTACI